MVKGVLRLTCVIMLFTPPSLACANEILITDNKAAQEAREIEEGVYAAPPGSKMQMHLFSIFSNKLAWPRTSLKVCFWNGTPGRQAEVVGIADQLTADLPIKLTWTGADGKLTQCPDFANDQGAWSAFDVRVALSANPDLLKPGDNQSAFFAMIGQQKPLGRRATINLPFLPTATKDFVRHKVLHEFCHVLGCLHEFQREICQKDFDPAAISRIFGLTPQQYRDNFEAIPSGHAFGVTAGATLDKTSVMMYALTREMFKPDHRSDCENDNPATTASSLDLAGLKAAYQNPTVRLRLDDFKALALSNRQVARSQAFLSASLRTTNSRWQSRNKGLNVNGDIQSAMLEELARDADLKAAQAEEEAHSFELTPDIERKVRLALSHFPAD